MFKEFSKQTIKEHDDEGFYCPELGFVTPEEIDEGRQKKREQPILQSEP
jgi:hypothetical protein